MVLDLGAIVLPDYPPRVALRLPGAINITPRWGLPSDSSFPCSRFVIYLCHSKKLFLMDGRNRNDIKPGIKVKIVLKQDQYSGKLTDGIVKDILTNSPNHPHGIKVRLQNGLIGRVKEILT
jgi:uncharacterized repeat protein (TIGR03833 family)